MDDLSKYLDKYQTKEKKGPRHEQSAKVDEILKVLGENDRYKYGFWLKYVSKWSFGQILEICKTAANLPDKYSRGGYIVNKLLKKK